MNIAYMLLVHSQSSQLVRLVDRLSQPNAYFFIHIDAKSGEKDTILNFFAGNDRVCIISEFNVNWMGFNMVRATIALMKLAAHSSRQYKYYVLMSGQDYPIKSNARITEFFSRHHSDFISFARISDSPDNYKNKVRRYHYYDMPFSNPRSPRRKPFLVYLYYGLQNRVMRHMPARRFYHDMEPFFGSQWFALTDETVRYILDFVQQHTGYLRFMRFTEGPDETFFQTIILNSDRAKNVYGYDRFEAWERAGKPEGHFAQEYSSLRYMDWSDKGKNEPRPAVLDMSYYDTLAESKDLFARKFDIRRSAELMERIDNNLLNGK